MTDRKLFDEWRASVKPSVLDKRILPPSTESVPRRKIFTAEHRANIGAARKGKKFPRTPGADGAPRKNRARAGGWEMAAEAKERISLANTGKKRTDETRKQMAESAKLRWERYRNDRSNKPK